jgi:phosphoheptose isomerase
MNKPIIFPQEERTIIEDKGDQLWIRQIDPSGQNDDAIISFSSRRRLDDIIFAIQSLADQMEWKEESEEE